MTIGGNEDTLYGFRGMQNKASLSEYPNLVGFTAFSSKMVENPPKLPEFGDSKVWGVFGRQYLPTVEMWG